MEKSPFAPKFDELPGVLPVFPLPQALLLPGGRLPLNIFEPRYLAMVDAALAGERMIGMIQPATSDGPGSDAKTSDPGAAPLYPTGCAGRLTAFAETDDGRYLITLSGFIRFDATRELPATRPYRRVAADYARFRADIESPGDADDTAVDRPRLLGAFRQYLQRRGLEGELSSVDEAGDLELVTALAMACPFSVAEQQALLEANSLDDRVQTLTALLELERGGQSDSRLHH
jgi:Lon protease-like protein